MQTTHMNCKLCGTDVQVEVRDGDDVRTVFCSPEDAHEWQHPRSERQIIEETGGWKMPYARCQWCRCTLKGGYHEEECPVRAVARKAGGS